MTEKCLITDGWFSFLKFLVVNSHHQNLKTFSSKFQGAGLQSAAYWVWEKFMSCWILTCFL